ncbi:Shedu anti-phage system protein SduA domain-containing protein [Chryseobacterium contaminans]|uniref:Shedu anti-phage system protein SduA domain-containing protein n=1 Tax=Chryseobacterium contaminans TaxID=1423959 RepID=UPI00301709C2
MENINHSEWYGREFKSQKIQEWENLLSKKLLENNYQTYLTENAGIFLSDDDCHLVISKLKLGSELETDFITLSDGFSNGNIFEFIEIKQPSAKLFTDKGLMTAEFNRATQQIRDWKRWLMDNRNWMGKYLPTVNTRISNPTHFKFKIIIGRRLSNHYEVEKRNQIAEEIGAEIRSFDYLTDKIKRREFYPIAWLRDGTPGHYEKELANPFYKAFTDSEWKKFCNSQKVASSHFYSDHFEEVLKMREYSSY